MKQVVLEEAETREIQKEANVLFNKKEIPVEKPTDEEMKCSEYKNGFLIEAQYSRGDMLRSLSTKDNNLEKIKSCVQVSTCD